jgi:uncharacterized membrane protein
VRSQTLDPDSKKADEGFASDFRRFFLRGLTALLPTLVTIAILIWAYHLVDQYIGQYITSGFIAVLARTAGAPTAATVDPDKDSLRYGTRTGELDAQGRQLTLEYELVHHPAHRGDPAKGRPNSLEYREALWRVAFSKYHLNVVGFLLAIALVYFVGFFVASFMGRTAWGILERFQERVPLVNTIYPHVKQIVEFLLSDDRVAAFRGVVAVEYPRRGLWSLGLLTGEGMRSLTTATHEDLVSIFIPSSPTPVTGYVITVPRSDVIELPLSIDEALRFTISGGVIKPSTEALDAESDVPVLTSEALASLGVSRSDGQDAAPDDAEGRLKASAETDAGSPVRPKPDDHGST